MAHWIVYDRGFGGTFYKCSGCGAIYCDIYKDVCGEDNCPNCGEPIDRDSNIYTKE